MSVHPMGKPAVTHYRIMEHFRAHPSASAPGNRAYSPDPRAWHYPSAGGVIRCTAVVRVRRGRIG
ncbi:hypothetical protein M8494_22450 [Serratia ureilytica]